MQDLDNIYLETINKQRLHLQNLQNNFNKICDNLTYLAEEEIKKLSPDDDEGKKTILFKLKTDITDELVKLKNAINSSQTKSIKTLEEINAQREVYMLDNLDDLIDKV